MNPEHAELQEEQKRVNQVVHEITERIHGLEQRVQGIQSDIVGIRKNFWEDVTVNLEDPFEAVETMASIRQQAEVLSEQERSYQNAAQQLKTFSRLNNSPYFGRIDFRENRETTSDVVYLGISSFVDNSGDNFLVYDWRAPISSLYYDYPPGPAQFTAPAGTIHGELELKRQYLIREGHILSVFDTGVTIGDELLQEVLGNQSDTHMRSIVATIQQDQNQIIRDTRSRLLIVQGAAGSGKTSAALQRVAFLLYRFRESLSSENIVLFSPNPLFASYVSAVLPELGEENMQQTTFQEYLEQPIGKTYKLEDPFTQLEYILTGLGNPDYETRISGIKYKAGFTFKDLIDCYVDALRTDGLIFRGIKFRGKLLISGKQLKKQFYAYHENISIPNRLRMLVGWALDELKVHEVKERTGRWVEDEIDLLDKETYMKAYHQLRSQNRFRGETFDDFEREKELLAEFVVGSYFKKLRATVKRLRFLDVPAVFRQLFAVPSEAGRFAATASLPEDWSTVCAQTLARLDEGELSYEDATPYVYLKERLLGTRTNTAIRHVFIDEAQDYSPFQFACIRQLFPHARMTVLGDVNQTIHIQATAGSDVAAGVNSNIAAGDASGFQSLASLFTEDETKTIMLTRSYRSTEPIIAFTSGIIPEGSSITAFHRTGPKPTVTQVCDEDELISVVVPAIKSLKSRGQRTIAVICKTEKESLEAYNRLCSHVNVLRVNKETSSFQTDVLVIPSYLAKGVEFDAVILYNASDAQYGQEHERKLFYTACTRAMHELHLFSVGEPTHFLSDVPGDTYIRN